MYDLLKLEGPGCQLVVRTTADRSSTRLEILTHQRWAGHHASLAVPDVQELASTLLTWLVENGHQLPELPAVDGDLEDADDDDEPAPVEHQRPAQDQPVPAGVPEHTRARSDARWPDCATGWHDRCGAPDRCGCPCHSSGQL